MATYLILNLVFLMVAGAALYCMKVLRWNKPLVLTLGALLIATAAFDSLIIYTGIVDYDYDKTLGLNIGLAPIEDFFYTLLAVIMIPGLWKLFGKEGLDG